MLGSIGNLFGDRYFNACLNDRRKHICTQKNKSSNTNNTYNYTKNTSNYTNNTYIIIRKTFPIIRRTHPIMQITHHSHICGSRERTRDKSISNGSHWYIGYRVLSSLQQSLGNSLCFTALPRSSHGLGMVLLALHQQDSSFLKGDLQWVRNDWVRKNVIPLLYWVRMYTVFYFKGEKKKSHQMENGIG